MMSPTEVVTCTRVLLGSLSTWKAVGNMSVGTRVSMCFGLSDDYY